jgi:hexokinase
MASTSAFAYSSAKDLYEHIDAQFQLSDNQLVELTKTFLHEFKLGLEGYGRAMAMMYVARSFTGSFSHSNPDPPS